MPSQLKSIERRAPNRYEVRLEVPGLDEPTTFAFQVEPGSPDVLQIPPEFYVYLEQNYAPQVLMEAILQFHRACKLELP